MTKENLIQIFKDALNTESGIIERKHAIKNQLNKYIWTIGFMYIRKIVYPNTGNKHQYKITTWEKKAISFDLTKLEYDELLNSYKNI